MFSIYMNLLLLFIVSAFSSGASVILRFFTIQCPYPSSCPSYITSLYSGITRKCVRYFTGVFLVLVTELLAAAAAHCEAIITCLAGGGW